MEGTRRRLRVLFAGEYIVDTLEAKLVWEKPNYPTYFFSQKDVASKYLVSTPNTNTFDLQVNGKTAPSSVTVFNDPSSPMNGLLKVTFGAMDGWFEEDEEIFIHPKDPYKRVDVLQSSRHVRVEIQGHEVANTNKPRLLFETNLPMRIYIPKTDCRMDLLVPAASNLSSQCPYKGVASYYDVRTPETGKEIMAKEIAWWYRTAQPECGEIKGFICFYDEFVDVFIDGQKQVRPQSPWSKRVQ